MKKFIIIFLINIFFVIFKVKCNAIDVDCEQWGNWSDCENNLISRTCKTNFSVHSLKSCRGCGKWKNWSPCINGKQFRHLSNCSHIMEENVCIDDKNENEEIKNVNDVANNINDKNTQSDNHNINDIIENEDTYQTGDELHKIESDNYNPSELSDVVNFKLDNIEENSNIGELNDYLDSSNDSTKSIYSENEENMKDLSSETDQLLDISENENMEDLFSKNGQLPNISENKEIPIKHHHKPFDSNSSEKENDKNEINSSLHENNNKIIQNNNIKEANMFRNNKSFKVRNKNKETNEIKKKTFSKGAKALEMPKTINTEEEIDPTNFYEKTSEAKHDDKKKKDKNSKNYERVYIASGVGVVLILTGIMAGYMLNKEKGEEDLSSEPKDENYEVTFNEDILKSKGIKAYYEEEFWAHE